jgi:hypothetical protein
MELQKTKDHAVKDLNLKVRRLQLLSSRLTDLVVDVSTEMANVKKEKEKMEGTAVQPSDGLRI